MFFKDLSTTDTNGIIKLKYDHPCIEQTVIDAIVRSEDITKAKELIIQDMSDIIAECTNVIRLTNAMKTIQARAKHCESPNISIK